MNFIDYRKKLGLSFSNSDKMKMFKQKSLFLLEKYQSFDFNDINKCLGNIKDLNYRYEKPSCRIDHYGRYYPYYEIIDFFEKFENLEFLYNFVILLNSISDYKQKNEMWADFESYFKECKIPVEIIEDDDGKFVFEKGAKEMDDGLISGPLEWLKDYPKSRFEFIMAIKKYQNITQEHPSEVADSFRKSLEQFFKEFFNSDKSLENYKSEYGNFLNEQGIPKGISNNFVNVLDMYAKFMNNYAKHKTNKKEPNQIYDANLKSLEYIMYQTGAIIRLLCTLKKDL